MLQRNSKLFASTLLPAGASNHLPHEIHLEREVRPICMAPYCTMAKEDEVIERELEVFGV